MNTTTASLDCAPKSAFGRIADGDCGLKDISASILSASSKEYSVFVRFPVKAKPPTAVAVPLLGFSGSKDIPNLPDKDIVRSRERTEIFSTERPRLV